MERKLVVRQYPINECGEEYKTPSQEQFAQALSDLSLYMRNNKGTPYYSPFLKDMVDDLRRNNPEIVVKYAQYAIKTVGSTIRPNIMFAILQSLQDFRERFLVLAENIFSCYEYNLEKMELYGTYNSNTIDLKIVCNDFKELLNIKPGEEKIFPNLFKLFLKMHYEST